MAPPPVAPPPVARPVARPAAGAPAAAAGETRLGFLYPGHAAEDDYPAARDRLGPGVAVDVVHTSVGTDAHRVADLLDLGGPERLAEGARSLAAARPHAVVWACTSGSFVFGAAGAADQVAALARVVAAPASSTSFAFVHAAAALGLARVAVAATYPPEVARCFVGFLEAHGLDVVASGYEDVLTAAEVATFGAERALAFVAAGDRPEAEAVLVPDTALHSVAWLEEAEARLGKPVLTANQVSVWEALRLAGALRPAPGLGRLFAP